MIVKSFMLDVSAHLLFVVISLNCIGDGFGADTSTHSDLQSRADIHTTDSCLQADRHALIAPHSPLAVVGIASLGARDTNSPGRRGSLSNECEFVLRPADDQSKLKIKLSVKKIGKARSFKAKKFRFEDPDGSSGADGGGGGGGATTAAPTAAKGKKKVASKSKVRKRFRRSMAATVLSTLHRATVEKGFGTFFTFQNDQRLLKRRKREAILGIPMQEGKDVFFNLAMEADSATSCFDCDGRCVQKEDVQCNFINDCNMEDEINCANPDNLTVIEPPVIVIAKPDPEVIVVPIPDPGTGTDTGTDTGTGTGTGTVTITGDDFEIYLRNCKPEVRESCIDLAACLGEPRCGPKSGTEFEKATTLIEQWKAKWKGDGSTSGGDFETYLKKCKPEVRESCVDLADCLEDLRCGPKSGPEFERATELINQWRAKWNIKKEDQEGSKSESSGGFPWWIIVVICLLIVIIVVIVVVIVVLRRRKKRRTMQAAAAVQDGNGNADKPITVQVSASGSVLEENMNQAGVLAQENPTETFESTIGSVDSRNNKLQQEFEKTGVSGSIAS